MGNQQRRELALLRKYSSRLGRMVESGTFHALPYSRRLHLVQRVRRLTLSLAGVVEEVALRRILAAAAAVVLGTAGCTSPSTGITSDGDIETHGDPAQETVVGPVTPSFAPPVDSPFGLSALGYGCGNAGIPAFTDLDGDGDQDLLIGTIAPEEGYGSVCLRYFENTGTATSPAFAPGVREPFGIRPTRGVLAPAFGDLDADGDPDLLMGAGHWPFYEPDSMYGDFFYYENTGTAVSPSFAAPRLNPFGLTGERLPVLASALADLDRDGDLDILASAGHYNAYLDATIRYYENTGTASSPSFAAPVHGPFGITIDREALPPALVDIDIDDDLDLFLGTLTCCGIYFHSNDGDGRGPLFAPMVSNPFGISVDSGMPGFADIDGDGDMDLFVIHAPGLIIKYLENTSM